MHTGPRPSCKKGARGKSLLVELLGLICEEWSSHNFLNIIASLVRVVGIRGGVSLRDRRGVRPDTANACRGLHNGSLLGGVFNDNSGVLFLAVPIFPIDCNFCGGSDQ